MNGSVAEPISLLAPAKLNLFFEVLGKRPDGYHEISTVTALVSLYDELSLSVSDFSENILLECVDPSGNDLSETIPTDGRNLAVKAARALAEFAGKTSFPKMRLLKRIPSEAGLGGGSSDAAAALKALNRFWNLNLPKETLQKIGASLGSDVPLFFEEGFAFGSGRGEITKPILGVSPFHTVIFKPPFGLSTAAVYKAVREIPSPEYRNPVPLAEALKSGHLDTVRSLLFNRLEETARSLSSELCGVMSSLSHYASFRLTGSGTALYLLTETAELAQKIALEIRESKVAGTVYTAEIISANL